MNTNKMPWWKRTDIGGPWFTVGADEVRLLRDGVEAFPAMLEAIANATREILLEIYWVAADAVGEKFRAMLVERAAAGVTVRVVYDAIGSFGIPRGFWKPLEDAGGEVREYHPLSPLRPAFDLARVEERDHRKMLVVDGTTGFTGGVNLARTWLPVEDGGQGWRDDMVEVRGYVAEELRTLFYKTWRRLWLRNLPQGRVRRGVPNDLVPLSRKPSRRVYVLSSLRKNRRSLRREYITRIHQAKYHIDIANSYFVPDRAVRNALYRAVLRGVRVRVLVPHKSDVTLVQFAIEAMYDSLLRRGVELYCHGGPMMHAKTAIIDDRFATIGSYNLDERSRTKNLEVNVAVDDEAFATYVRRWFDRDIEAATKIDLYEWRARPLLRRGVESMAFALRKLW
ncbi:MAG: phospholipase D-like domain-containing protein [Polyangiaceae bacterium]|nr:phospholipase D-like domain-containing protein [Polyangiaceae bacterium]